MPVVSDDMIRYDTSQPVRAVKSGKRADSARKATGVKHMGDEQALEEESGRAASEGGVRARGRGDYSYVQAEYIRRNGFRVFSEFRGLPAVLLPAVRALFTLKSLGNENRFGSDKTWRVIGGIGGRSTRMGSLEPRIALVPPSAYYPNRTTILHSHRPSAHHIRPSATSSSPYFGRCLNASRYALVALVLLRNSDNHTEV
ncbi:hypothetical protein BDV93DRAFT_542481 [Ceratobasidium sp. AG-I]|nr:hypothetical protein BDV93DRAFT_542481 [Ceratobasidium sp. AG-I]